MNDRDNELLEITEGIKDLAIKYGCKSRVIDTLNDTKNVFTGHVMVETSNLEK